MMNEILAAIEQKPETIIFVILFFLLLFGAFDKKEN